MLDHLHYWPLPLVLSALAQFHFHVLNASRVNKPPPLARRGSGALCCPICRTHGTSSSLFMFLSLQYNGQPEKNMLNSFLKNAYDISAVGFSGDKDFSIFRGFALFVYSYEGLLNFSDCLLRTSASTSKF